LSEKSDLKVQINNACPVGMMSQYIL